MARVYSVNFAAVSVSAAQDLITLFTGVKAIKVHSVTLGQSTVSAVANLPVSLKRLPATVTPGSGGSTPTPQATSPNDTAATVTAHVNDTARSTTSGTPSVLVADDFNVINGYLWLPPEHDRVVAGPNQAIVVSLDGAPASPETMSGTIVFEELF